MNTEAIPIEELHETDVLFGYMNSKKDRKANILYSTIIEVHQWQYCLAGKSHKDEIAQDIYTYYSKNKYRFLHKQNGEFCNIISSREDSIKKIKASLNNGLVARKDKLLQL